MNHETFIEKCKELVAAHTNRGWNTPLVSENDVYVVWSCKTLQNSKALLSTPVPDAMYYEVTLNGTKGEIYFDAYKKVANIKYTVAEAK